MWQLLSRSVYSVVLWRRKTSNFAIFKLWHFVLSPVGSVRSKLNMDAQLQTFPYPTMSKSYLARSANLPERLIFYDRSSTVRSLSGGLLGTKVISNWVFFKTIR